VGLGNPGKKYESTATTSASPSSMPWAKGPGVSAFHDRFDAAVAEWMENGAKVLLMKPETSVNLSGRAVREAVDFSGSRLKTCWSCVMT